MSQATEDLALALAARRKVMQGQSARWGNRQINRADLGALNETIAMLKHEVAREQMQARGQTGPAIARFHC